MAVRVQVGGGDAVEQSCEVSVLCVTLSVSLYRPPCNRQTVEERLGASAHLSE